MQCGLQSGLAGSAAHSITGCQLPHPACAGDGGGILAAPVSTHAKTDSTVSKSIAGGQLQSGGSNGAGAAVAVELLRPAVDAGNRYLDSCGDDNPPYAFGPQQYDPRPLAVPQRLSRIGSGVRVAVSLLAISRGSQPAALLGTFWQATAGCLRTAIRIQLRFVPLADSPLLVIDELGRRSRIQLNRRQWRASRGGFESR